jgi:signal peptidase I
VEPEATDVGESANSISPAGDGKPNRKKQKQSSTLRELPILIVIALGLALLIKTFLTQAFFIPSGSMEPTLNVGDRVLVNKLTPWFGAEPERGQVVVFRDPGGWLAEAEPVPTNPITGGIKKVFVFVGLLPSDSERDLVKRVIGVGGDMVKCCDADGRVTVNGTPLAEPYLFPGNAPSDRPFEVTVPQGRLWVMGDHRNNSADSRAHMGDSHRGTISEDDVIGRAFFVIWPADHWQGLPVPETFEQKALSMAASPAAPYAVGLVGAVPITLVLRRRRLRAAGMPEPNREG